MVGASSTTVGSNYYVGAVYVYEKGRTGWSATPTTTLPGFTYQDAFGAAVALDGNRLVVGSDFGGTGQGVVYVYANGKGGWPTTPATTVMDPGPVDPSSNGNRFGSAVAIESHTMVVGAFGTYAYNGSSLGQAYIYAP